MNAAMITGLLAIGAAVVTAIVTAWLSRRKDEASYAEVLVRTSKELLDPLRTELRSLRADVLALTKQVAEAKAETELCHREREADRSRIRTLEYEVAHYKAGGGAHYNTDGNDPWLQD